MERIINVNTYLDRRPADLQTNDVITYLSQPISIKQNQKVTLQLQNIELPNTAYTFPYHSYIFYYYRNDILRSLSLDLDRVYNSGSDIATDLNNKAAALSYPISFTYDTNKYKLSIINNDTVQIRVVGSFRYYDSLNVAYNNVIDRLGFSQDMTNLYIPVGGILQAANPPRLLRTNVYYIQTDVIGNAQKQNIFPYAYNNDKLILARITASNFGNLSQLSFISTVEISVNTTTITAIKFQILDDELYDIDLNNFPITFSLKLTVQ